MDIKKAKEIIKVFKSEASLYSTPDLKDALTIALICMSFCDGMIKAQGEDAITRLERGIF